MTEYTPRVTGTGVKARVQRFGGFLAGMVMPNIGAFIAWGLITALFIPTGWLPNETFALLVGPMITFLLPLLIGYTGGRIVHGQRGAVAGAIATMGVIIGAISPLAAGSTVESESVISGGSTPMFLGAMIIGPLAAWLVKMADGFIQERVRAGFEMLVDNFTLGIIGGAMALLGQLTIGPVVRSITAAAGDVVDWLVERSLLPLASIIVEPAKVLFLNNAINQGVFTPLGAAESAETGKSVLFMIESNPGPGLGILLAYLFFGPRSLRPSVPGAIIIHFLGGIHEIYFPYVLMKPKMILAAIAGGATGVGTFMVTGAGLVATPSPGSIFAYLIATPRGGYFGVLLGVLLAAAVSFAVGSVLLGFGRGEKLVGDDAAADTAVEAGQRPVDEPASSPASANRTENAGA